MYFSQLSKAIGPRLVLSNPLSATPPHFSSLYVSTFRWPAKNSYYELEVAKAVQLIQLNQYLVIKGINNFPGWT